MTSKQKGEGGQKIFQICGESVYILRSKRGVKKSQIGRHIWNPPWRSLRCTRRRHPSRISSRPFLHLPYPLPSCFAYWANPTLHGTAPTVIHLHRRSHSIVTFTYLVVHVEVVSSPLPGLVENTSLHDFTHLLSVVFWIAMSAIWKLGFMRVQNWVNLVKRDRVSGLSRRLTYLRNPRNTISQLLERN